MTSTAPDTNSSQSIEVARANSKLSNNQRTIFGEEAKSVANKLREHIDKDRLRKEEESTKKAKKKGTLTGVFVPTIEGMWGVLIFLKFNYIVGIGGIWQALVAVFVSFIAALCTTICVSAIASSGGVASEGGPYYMISRSLGPYIGVSVGVTYFIGIVFLGAMEVAGSVEALVILAPDALDFKGAVQALGSGIVFVLSLLVYGGINLVTKLGVVFGLVVLFTVIAYYVSLGIAPLADRDPSIYLTGLDSQTFRNNWSPMYPEGKDFGTLMSLFFPCFTGILSGADRSDVLRDPPKNIMYGTLGAITVSFLIYTAFMLMWGAVADGCYLRGDCPAAAVSATARRLSGSSGREATIQIADEMLWPNKYVVVIGVIISCFSQTLQCIIVAPRLLRAIAADHLIGWLRPIGILSKSGEPARALLVTYILSAGLVLIGSVDILAPMVTISFLICYGFLNISCLVLTVLRTPTWRPSGIFKLRWRVFYIVASVLGFAGCLAISLIVSRYWTVGVIFFAIALYWYVASSGEEVEWGSGLDGLRYGLALSALTGLKREQHRRINWRPQILAVFPLGNVATTKAATTETAAEFDDNGKTIQHMESGQTRSSMEETEVNHPDNGRRPVSDQLLLFCGQLRKGRGMCMVAGVLEGCPSERTREVRDRIEGERARIDALMAQNDIRGFSDVVAATSWYEGAKYVSQLSGLGGLRPNTLLISWPTNWRSNPQESVDFLKIVSQALSEDKAVVCPRNVCALPLGELCQEQSGTIDLWWFITDGGLLVLITWLLAQHKVWRNCSVRVFVVVENVGEDVAEMAADTVRKLFKQKRILSNVTVEAVTLSDEMIEPYTYDLTLKMNRRRAAGGSADGPSTLPHTLDDLFEHHVDEPEEAADVEPVTSAVTTEESGTEKSKFRRLLSTAMHPRRAWRERRRIPRSRSGSADRIAPEPKSLTQAFARQGTIITEDNEKVLLDTLNQRCRQRRAEMDIEQRRDSTDDEVVSLDKPAATLVEEDEEEESVLGDLIPFSSTSPVNQSSATFDRLNQVIVSRSKDSSLVLMNLPDIWGTSAEDCASYMAFCECLIRGLDKVIFVQSSGNEVVRIL